MAINQGQVKSFNVSQTATVVDSGNVGATPDVRRIYNFGDRVADLTPEESPFFVYLSKVSKVPTDDSVFRYLEDRSKIDWTSRDFALAADVNGSKVTTIEGLVTDGKMHPMQEAFKKMHGLQCGFCTPGMVMSAIDLLKSKKNPSDTEIRGWLEGNICRCTGYQNIVAAVKEASSKM